MITKRYIFIAKYLFAYPVDSFADIARWTVWFAIAAKTVEQCKICKLIVSNRDDKHTLKLEDDFEVELACFPPSTWLASDQSAILHSSQ